MNFKKVLTFALLILATNSISAGELSPTEFINCYKKAINERIEEIKDKKPGAEMCDQLSSTEERLLDSLYLDAFIIDGKYTRFSSAAISNASLQSHYDLIKREKQKYDISCYDSRFHLLKRTDLDLIEEGLEKMFNVKLGFKGWQNKVKDLDLSYCK